MRAPALPDTADTSVVAGLTRDAVALAPLFKTEPVEEFLAAAPLMPPPSRAHPVARLGGDPLVQRGRAGAPGPSPSARSSCAATCHRASGTTPATARRWPTRAPSRCSGEHGLKSLRGLRVLDFGYGGAGSITLLGQAGAVAVGVDVDPRLRALYAGDPAIEGWTSKAGGKARTVDGRWPADAAAREAVGEGYDLVLSKNTLKRGYIHPERPADPRQLVNLGVDDTTFVRALHRVLKPGGRLLIYNLSPAPSKPDETYKPWSDGRTPFPRALFEREGFTVLAYDVNDDAPARAMGKALGWASGMDLENDLFGHYTLVEKKR